MMKLYSKYIEIYKALNSFCDDWKTVEDSLIAFQNSAVEKKSAADKSFAETSRDITSKEKLLEAYLNIAGAHTAQQKASENSLPFDEEKLRRISVQINNSYHDIYAAQLYTEATGQLKFLKEERITLRKKTSESKNRIDQEIQAEQQRSRQCFAHIKNEVITYLNSDTYQSFISLIKKEHAAFDFSGFDKAFAENNMLDIGELDLPFPTIPDFEDELFALSDCFVNQKAHTLSIPYGIDLRGCVLLAEYSNETEAELLQGIQSVLLNIARYDRNIYNKVVFIDPIRFNNSGLGCLSPLSEGKNSFISRIPASIDEIRRLLKLTIDTINEEEHNCSQNHPQTTQRKIFVFHNFPQSYDETLVSNIRQLCVNATYYGITVILTNNPALRSTTGSEILEYIKTGAKRIRLNRCGEHKIFCQDVNSYVTFRWFKAPQNLPDDVRQYFITEKPVTNLGNKYEEHFDLTQLPLYSKGDRSITNIPYGITADGTILYLDFENTNFATYICGASRSGKSTLLHTIITGIIQNKHPDDVEIWLIDFKMTEFSRYISHLPPHIRYIILDESPELVYDIIDRLSEILSKRQTMFKQGEWDKLSDVPAEQYMPSIFVIIDEFSVMSQIIADSVTMGKDNYALKLQTLLAKGAALGMHFIFASQGFTSGTRGLNDFSKRQVQQRIAMRTEVSEIKATLDLQSIGDDDRSKMEQLPVYHTLVKSRVPIDIRGNYLIYSQVLYISEHKTQLRYIDRIKNHLTPVPKYNPTDSEVYIDKKAMIVDGSRYVSFESCSSAMQDYLQHPEREKEKVALFVGEPLRMLKIYPMILERDFQQNVLLIGSIDEQKAMASIILSIVESLKLLGIPPTIIAAKNNRLYRHVQHVCDISRSKPITDTESICNEIRALKQRIAARVHHDEVYMIFGLEAIFSDMIFSMGGDAHKEHIESSSIKYERRKEGEPDILTLLAKAEQGEDIDQFSPGAEQLEADPPSPLRSDCIYDAREDLKYVLTQGAKLGYHFILPYHSVAEFKQTKLDAALFKHRIFFRTPRIYASEIVDSTNASLIAVLPNRCFRYTDGLDSLSFRPYLHAGIVIDGWQIAEDGTVGNVVDETENYLL